MVDRQLPIIYANDIIFQYRTITLEYDCYLCSDIYHSILPDNTSVLHELKNHSLDNHLNTSFLFFPSLWIIDSVGNSESPITHLDVRPSHADAINDHLPPTTALDAHSRLSSRRPSRAKA